MLNLYTAEVGWGEPQMQFVFFLWSLGGTWASLWCLLKQLCVSSGWKSTLVASMQCGMKKKSCLMHLRKKSRALCIDGGCGSLGSEEKAWGSSCRYYKSVMQSVVKDWRQHQVKALPWQMEKAGKLGPKLTASLLLVPIKRRKGGFCFVPKQGVKGGTWLTSLLVL